MRQRECPLRFLGFDFGRVYSSKSRFKNDEDAVVCVYFASERVSNLGKSTFYAGFSIFLGCFSFSLENRVGCKDNWR
jgi:hypothetical protein